MLNGSLLGVGLSDVNSLISASAEPMLLPVYWMLASIDVCWMTFLFSGLKDSMGIKSAEFEAYTSLLLKFAHTDNFYCRQILSCLSTFNGPSMG